MSKKKKKRVLRVESQLSPFREKLIPQVSGRRLAIPHSPAQGKERHRPGGIIAAGQKDSVPFKLLALCQPPLSSYSLLLICTFFSPLLHSNSNRDPRIIIIIFLLPIHEHDVGDAHNSWITE